MKMKGFLIVALFMLGGSLNGYALPMQYENLYCTGYDSSGKKIIFQTDDPRNVKKDGVLGRYFLLREIDEGRFKKEMWTVINICWSINDYSVDYIIVGREGNADFILYENDLHGIFKTDFYEIKLTCSEF